jgi:uncharacterized Zn finger protein
MATSNVTLCPQCGSAHLNWRVQRSGRRGQPLAGRELLWNCTSCGAIWGADALVPEPARVVERELGLGL